MKESNDYDFIIISIVILVAVATIEFNLWG